MIWFQERLDVLRYRTDGVRDRFSYRGPTLYDLRYRFGERRAQAAYERELRRRSGGGPRYRWADLAPATRKLTAAGALFAVVTASLVALVLFAGTERPTSRASGLDLTPTSLPLLLVPDEPTTSSSTTTPTLPPPVETVETTVAPVAPTPTVAKATTTTRKSTPTTKKSTPTTKAPTRLPSATNPTTTKPTAAPPTSPPTSPSTTLPPVSPSTTLAVGAP